MAGIYYSKEWLLVFELSCFEDRLRIGRNYGLSVIISWNRQSGRGVSINKTVSYFANGTEAYKNRISPGDAGGL